MATIKHERKCICCGEHYSYCNTCAEDQTKPTWYRIFCSDNCHDIYNVTLRYGDGLLTQGEAHTALNKLDITKKDQMHPVIKSRINEIMGIKEPKKKVEDEYEG